MAAPNFRINSPEVFTAFNRAVLDAFSEGVVVFDSAGEMVYASDQARVTAGSLLEGQPAIEEDLLPELAKLGGRLNTVRVDGLSVGKVVFLPNAPSPSTLAQREKAAIIKTLDEKAWKLTDAAEELGISRTTLWRRLRVYGLRPRKKGKIKTVETSVESVEPQFDENSKDGGET